MAHWSPIFEEVDYLPHILFPFLLIYNNDELAILETVISIFTSWGRSWFSTFPNPPLNLIDSIAQLLQFHDKSLYLHITKTLNSCPGVISWGMISTLFSEVFDKAKWCVLFDFLFAYFSKPNLLQLVSVAILRELRSQILEMGPEFSRSFYSFFQQALVIDVTKVVYETKKLLRDKVSDGHVEANPVVDDDGAAVETLKQSMESSTGRNVFPLPRGHYPLFDGYPMSLKDGEIQDRSRMLSFTQILAEKKDVVTSLEQEIEAHNEDHTAWIMKQKDKLAFEASSRQKRNQLERQHLEELLNIEAKVSQTKLDAMKAMEEYASKEMSFIEELQAERMRAENDEAEQLKVQKEFETRIARLRSVAERAEVKAKESLLALSHRRAIVDESYRDERAKSFADAESGRNLPSLSATSKRSAE